MRAVFDEGTAYFRRMLDVEAALRPGAGAVGNYSAGEAAAAIGDAAKNGDLRPEVPAGGERCANVGYPVVGLVSELSRGAGEAGGWTHWGATTQDIMDTATVLQVRSGLDLIEAEMRAIVAALTDQARTTSGHGHGRPHPSATGFADDLRS